MKSGVLTLVCPDRRGIVSPVFSFLCEIGANITEMDQHSTEVTGGTFFMRVAFSFEQGEVDYDGFVSEFGGVVAGMEATWRIFDDAVKLKMGILVSKHEHCLINLLFRVMKDEIGIEVPFVISNHEDVGGIVAAFGVPFFHVPSRSGDRRESEILDLVKNSEGLILARYMQILSPDFLSQYGRDIINIHHSFLPSFKGADPYQQAFDRGVKIIGATGHFVTEDLDEGPIISQEVTHVTHRDGAARMRQVGRDVERVVLAEAVRLYAEHRVFRYGNKTIVF